MNFLSVISIILSFIKYEHKELNNSNYGKLAIIKILFPLISLYIGTSISLELTPLFVVFFSFL